MPLFIFLTLNTNTLSILRKYTRNILILMLNVPSSLFKDQYINVTTTDVDILRYTYDHIQDAEKVVGGEFDMFCIV